MNTFHGTALGATLLGALALTGQPAMANPAHHGGATDQLVQAEQQAREGAPSTAEQSPMMGGQGSGGMMMDPQMMKRMMQMHGMMHGMMAQGGQGMGSGMASGTMGQGMMGSGLCAMMAGGDKDYSAEQVKDILQGHIAWTGNDRLKVGTVEPKDDDTYVAEIVTVDDSLVHKVEVDRKSGAVRPAE